MRKLTHKYLVLLLLTSAAAMAQSQFDYVMKLGDDAMKEYHYSDAVDYYKRAVALNDKSLHAHLGVAKASSQMYVPNVPIPENEAYGETGWNEYQKALEIDPKNVEALRGSAELGVFMHKFDPAKGRYRQLIAVDPKDSYSYYSIAMMDWSQSFHVRHEVRTQLALADGKPLIHSAKCAIVRTANQPRVDEAIKMLNQSLTLGPDDVNSMAVMELIYREKADIECGNTAAYSADIRESDKWVETRMVTEKRTGKKNSVIPPPPPAGVVGGIVAQ